MTKTQNTRGVTLPQFRRATPTRPALLAYYRALWERARANDSHAMISVVDWGDIEARLAETWGRDDLALAGVPYTVKDNVDVCGMRTTCACPGFSYDATHDATIVRVLNDLGAVLVGKTNMDQFATGLVGTRSPYGVVRNCHDERYISGGSSSGAARSVVDGSAVLAVGTDTAGSGRVPAAMQGIVGVKPSRDIIPTAGVVPACESIDCVALFTHDARDAAFVYAAVTRALSAESPRAAALVRTVASDDPTATTPPAFRFAVPEGDWLTFHGDAKSQRSFAKAVAHLQHAASGQLVSGIDFGLFSRCALLLYEDALVAERFASVGDAIERMLADGAGNGDEKEALGLDKSVQSIILGSRHWSGADVYKAQSKLREFKRRTEKDVWTQIDVLMVPTVPTVFTVDQIEQDPIKNNSVLGTYMNFVNLLDLCAVAVPCTDDAKDEEDGIPRGVTLIAPALHDWKLLQIAKTFQVL